MEDQVKKAKKRKNSSLRCYACGNNESECSYFNIPSDPKRKMEWMKALELPVQASGNHRICNKHFLDSDYTVSGKRLRKDAVPSASIKVIPQEKRVRTYTKYKCYFCGKSSGCDSSNRCFFKFPEDPVNFQTWVKFCNSAEELILPSTYLCSDHFAPNSIIGSLEFGKKRQLRPNTIPTIKGTPVDSIDNLNDDLNQYIIVDNVGNDDGEQCILQVNSSSSVSEEEVTLNPPSTPTSHMQYDAPFHVPRYVGQIHTPHLATPRRAKACFKMAKKVIFQKNKIIKKLKQNVSRLKKKIRTLKDLTSHLRRKDMISENARVKLLESMPIYIRELMQRAEGNDKSTKKYSPALRTFALTLKFYSNRAYKYVRKVWKGLLPAPSTIRKWYQVIDGSPGFTKESFTAITLRAETNRIPVSLVIDEMSVRQQLIYKNGKQYGQVNMGSSLMVEESDNVPEAKNALVFMAVSLKAGWKIPVGYFLIDGLTSKERANLVKICLELLEQSKADVHCLTFDGAGVNITMAEILGANFSYGTTNFKPWFSHPVTKENVYIMPDPSHMIKLVRNTLGESLYLLDSENNRIKWSDICSLLHLEEKEGLKIATKITKKHIHYDDDVMSVRLAVQTLSSSVSTALIFAQQLGFKEFEKCNGTAIFCQTMNNAFDILNCRSKFTKRKYSIPIMPENFDFLQIEAEKIIKYIVGLKVGVERKCTDKNNLTTIKYEEISILKSRRKTGFYGFIVALTNIFNIYKALKEKGQQYLLSYKISQDHLESFFGAIRTFGGHNNSPNCYQFEIAYRNLLIHNEVAGSESGNVTSTDDIKVLNVPSTSKTPSEKLEKTTAEINKECEDDLDEVLQELWDGVEDDKNDDELDAHAEPITQLTRLVEEIIKYIAGFVSRKAMRKLQKKLPATALEELIDPNKESGGSLLRIKDRGGLCNPSESVLITCFTMEKLLRKNVTQNYSEEYKQKIYRSTRDLVDTLVFNNSEPKEKEEMLSAIISTYYDLRIHHELKMKSIKNKYIRRRLTKAILFRNE